MHPPVDAVRLRVITAAAQGVTVVNAPDEAAAVREMADADAFFGKLTEPMLAAAGSLRWVQSPTASLEHYIFPALVEHPCQLTNMRGLFSDVIADHVFGYVISFARNFHVYARKQMAARWAPVGGESQRTTFAAGPGNVGGIDRAHLHLADCTLGVVGLGSIGQEVARRARAFGMKVVAVDPLLEEPPEGVAALWKPADLGSLLVESDFVVIAAPHTPATEGWFGPEQFRRMRSSAYLINIGRGAIVQLDALVAALEAGELAGAGLDVFQIEPLPEDHPLWKMENVIITPHVAGASVRIAERHLATFLDNLGRFVRGEPLTNVCDKAEWF